MDGQLAHALATSLWGDRWLTHGSVDVAGFEADHSTAVLVSGVDFIDPVGEHSRSLEDWLAELRRQGVQRVRLVLGQEHPGYALYADGPAPTVWVPSWSVGDFRDPRGKIWTVTYRGELLPEELPAPELTVEDAFEALQAAVSRCLRFARTQQLPQWQATFDQARRTLGIGNSELRDYPDLIPPGTSATVRRLLSAAAQTQISSPMDAWPHLHFDDPSVHQEYEAAARQLHTASMEAFVAATAGARRGPRPAQKTELPGFVKKLLPKKDKAADVAAAEAREEPTTEDLAAAEVRPPQATSAEPKAS